MRFGGGGSPRNGATRKRLASKGQRRLSSRYDASVIDPAEPDDPLTDALRSVVAGAIARWDQIQGDPPELLYHYTDVDGLIGICSSGTLRATNLRFMNDAKEIDHAWRLMLDVLGHARERADQPAQHAVIDAIEQNLSSWEGFPEFYSVSFSAEGDLLGQWRGYGSTGGGYAIGIDPTGLACPPTSYPQPERFLNRVIYNEKHQVEILGEVADSMLALFGDGAATEQETTEADARLLSALGEVAGYVFSFKDPAWAEEQEWRAVYVVPHGEHQGVQFRAGGGVAVPFVPLAMGTDPGGRLPIRRIVQGPSADPDMSTKSLQLLLSSNGYPDTEIAASTVPLRL